MSARLLVLAKFLQLLACSDFCSNSGSIICTDFETIIDAENHVSRLAKLRKDGEICTCYMNVSGNMFLVLLKMTGVRILRERYLRR